MKNTINEDISLIIRQVQANYDAGKDDAITISEVSDILEKNKFLSSKMMDEDSLPTKWFKTEQINTWVGGEKGGRGQLIINHQCGDNKEELIKQLKTMISGLENDFDAFSS